MDSIRRSILATGAAVTVMAVAVAANDNARVRDLPPGLLGLPSKVGKCRRLDGMSANAT